MKKYFRIDYLNLEITDRPEKLALQNELSPPQDFTTKNTCEIRHDKLLKFQPSSSCGMFLYDCSPHQNQNMPSDITLVSLYNFRVF